MRFDQLVGSVLAVTALGLSGCGKDDDDDKKATVAATELEGTWVQSCGSDEGADVEGRTFDKTTNVFTGNTVSISVEGFSDDKCTVKTYSSKATATFKISEAVTTPAGAKGTESTPTSVYMKLHQAA